VRYLSYSLLKIHRILTSGYLLCDQATLACGREVLKIHELFIVLKEGSMGVNKTTQITPCFKKRRAHSYSTSTVVPGDHFQVTVRVPVTISNPNCCSWRIRIVPSDNFTNGYTTDDLYRMFLTTAKLLFSTLLTLPKGEVHII
jgi:hypothetical protein